MAEQLSSWTAWERSDSNAAETALVTPCAIKEETRGETDTQASFMDPERFGTYTKLLRVTALSLRFINNLRTSRTNRQIGPLTSREMDDAECHWIHRIQQEAYGKEHEYLNSPALQRRAPQPTLVRQLGLCLTDNLIQCAGRLQNAQIPDDARRPILLPPKHRVTELIIRDEHDRGLYCGLSSTVARLRQRWWVPQARQRVRSVLHRCVKCRRVTGAPYIAPPAPPLPNFRVTESAPFEVTGVDLVGPLYVINGPTQQSVYIVLFTCAATRAVHLEIMEDQRTETFLRAFKRFTSRRSTPRLILSDNARYFKGASEILKKIYNHPTLQNDLSLQRVEWRFIPSRAPWFGGFWERLVALIKNPIKKVLGRSHLTFDQLHTLITEIKAVINDRLTFWSVAVSVVSRNQLLQD